MLEKNERQGVSTLLLFKLLIVWAIRHKINGNAIFDTSNMWLALGKSVWHMAEGWADV